MPQGPWVTMFRSSELLDYGVLVLYTIVNHYNCYITILLYYYITSNCYIPTYKYIPTILQYYSTLLHYIKLLIIICIYIYIHYYYISICHRCSLKMQDIPCFSLPKKKQLDHVLMNRDSAVGDPSSHTSETLVVIVRPKIARENDTHMWVCMSENLLVLNAGNFRE